MRNKVDQTQPSHTVTITSSGAGASMWSVSLRRLTSSEKLHHIVRTGILYYKRARACAPAAVHGTTLSLAGPRQVAAPTDVPLFARVASCPSTVFQHAPEP